MTKTKSTKSHQATPHQGRARKEQLVAQFVEKVGKAKGIVFTNYQGLTHQQLETLKKAVKKLDAEFVTTKNRLLARALADKNISLNDKQTLEGPTATLFAYADVIEPLKHITKMIKDLKMPVIKFGFLSREAGSGSPAKQDLASQDAREKWQILSEADILKLSSLPLLPMLRSQLLGQMMSPIQGLHRALSWNMTKLVMTLNAVAQKNNNRL